MLPIARIIRVLGLLEGVNSRQNAKFIEELIDTQASYFTS